MALKVIAIGMVQVPEDCNDPVVILRGSIKDVKDAARLFGENVDLYHRKGDEQDE